MDPPINAHPKLAVWLYPDAIFLPDALHICVGELHLEGGSLSFKGFLICQAFADRDLSSCIGCEEMTRKDGSVRWDNVKVRGRYKFR